MSLNGAWTREGSYTELYNFDEATQTLTIRAPEPSSDLDGETTPPPTAPSSSTPPQYYRFALSTDGTALTLTPAAGTVGLVPIVFQVKVRSDARLVLEKQLQHGTDSMEAETITLVPDGYPVGGPGFEAEEEDDGEEGVDMGLDLCIVGKKI